jgi:Leucine-rich repeat (LRR) protein
MGNSITTPTPTTTLPSLPMIRALERIAAMEPYEIDLDLSYLGLTELPPLPERLSILKCAGNHLTALPDVLPAGLWELHCQGNELTCLPTTLSAELMRLNCSKNRLTSLPATLPASLNFLRCNDNRLTELPDTLPASLLYLICDNNKLTSMPATLPERLQYIDCSDNRSLGGRVPFPDSLLILNCCVTELTELPARKPARLEFLNCTINRLTTLPDWVAELDQLICVANWSLECQQDASEYYNPSGFLARLRTAEEAVTRERIVSRCAAIKEDLMAAAWAPARVERLLEAGMDLDDC